MDQIERLSPTVGNNGTAPRAVDMASSSAHGAIDKASATVIPAVDRMTIGAHQAVDSLAVAASGAVASVSAKANQLKDNQALATEKCRGYVRENPLASVGVALTAGFVLSWLIRSR